MKKRMMTVAALVLLAALLFACTPGIPSETDALTQTEAGSSGETDSQNESQTESQTEVASESASETESASEPETEDPSGMTEQERIRYLYEHTDEKLQRVVAWGISHDPDHYEDFFRLLLDAGVNTALADEEYYGAPASLFGVVEAAEKTGMDLYINTFGDSGRAIAAKLFWVVDSPAVVGIYLRDEPLPSMFEELRSAIEDLHEELPESMRWPIGANLFPAVAMGGGYGNYSVVTDYVSTVRPDFLCWDFYPFSSQTSKNSRFPIYLANLLQMKMIAGDAKIPLYSFIQTSRINSQEPPSTEQLRLLIHSALALGSESLFLFTVGQIGEDEEYTGNGETFGYLISADCSHVTEAYYRLSEVLHDIHNMKGIYLNYDLLFADFYNLPAASALVDAYRINPMIASVYEDYQGITSSDPDASAVIGYFTKDEENGDDGIYVVNADYTFYGNDSDFTLHFSEVQTYQIWGSEGLEAIGSGDTITLTLRPGDGKFVVLNADNTVPEET